MARRASDSPSKAYTCKVEPQGRRLGVPWFSWEAWHRPPLGPRASIGQGRRPFRRWAKSAAEAACRRHDLAHNVVAPLAHEEWAPWL